MKIEKLVPGMTVYDVGRQKMGNTNLSTVAVWPVRIVSVNVEAGTVEASWNGNHPRTYHRTSWTKWRATQPKLVRLAMGGQRLATREEIAEAKADAKESKTN